MLVVTGPEMRSLETEAFERLGFPPLLMMENAGSRIVEVLKNEYGCLRGKRIHILVGTGNNGGDGLVVARQLLALGARPKVYLVGVSSKTSEANATNLDIVRKLDIDLIKVEPKQLGKLKFSLGMADLIIDAILGTGFSGTLHSELGSFITMINEIQRPLVAIDTPTGVDASTGQVTSVALKADLTIHLGVCKVGCVLYPGKGYAGKNLVVDLGLPLPDLSIQRELLGSETLTWLPERDPWGHKGTFGHTLVVAGSKYYAGAASLSGQAVLRAGGGLATLAIPQGIFNRFSPDELIVIPLAETDSGSLGEASVAHLLELLEGKDALVLGPGLARHAEVTQMVQALLRAWSGPTVLDADALMALSDEFLNEIPLAKRKRWVLTPHPGEMARMLGTEAAEINRFRLQIARDFAEKWGVVLVLKGAPTIIADSQMTYINSTGNSGLGTAGSGDVLSGIIGSFMAQRLDPLKAAAAAVYVHGKAGDLAALNGQRGLLASDCLAFLQEVLG